MPEELNSANEKVTQVVLPNYLKSGMKEANNSVKYLPGKKIEVLRRNMAKYVLNGNNVEVSHVSYDY